MVETLLVVAIALSLVSVTVGIVVLVMVLKRKENTASNSTDLKPVTDTLASLPLLVRLAVSEQMTKDVDSDNKRFIEFQDKIVNKLAENIESDNKRINEFQASLNKQLHDSIDALNKKIDDQMKAIDEKVDKSLKDGFEGTSDSMEKLNKALGVIEEAQKNIQNLSDDVLSLKGVLSNNQQRGRYGEMQLEMIVESMLGASNRGSLFDFQYTYKVGENTYKPDAVIFMDDEKKSVVCIDSKFSMAGYEALLGDSKLDDETKKSLKADFKSAIQVQVKEVQKYVDSGIVMKPALMFIPNDGIFAYIQNEYPEVVEDARNKEVVMVSPTILQPVIASFRVARIDAKRAKNLDKINEALGRLGVEFKRFEERWEKMEKNINTLKNSSEDFGKTVNKMNKRFGEISTSNVEKIEHAPIEDSPYELE